jgi:hypothetical protein
MQVFSCRQHRHRHMKNCKGSSQVLAIPATTNTQVTNQEHNYNQCNINNGVVTEMKKEII